MAIVVSRAQPLSEDDLAQLERELGLELPPQYRGFLLANNGGSPRFTKQGTRAVVARSCPGLPASVYGPPDAKPELETFFCMDKSPPMPPNLGFANGTPHLAPIPGTLLVGLTVRGQEIRLGCKGEHQGKILFLDARGLRSQPEPRRPERHTAQVAASFDAFLELANLELAFHGPALAEPALAALEKTTGLGFPAPYREFLLSTNGGAVARGSVLRGGEPPARWCDAVEALHGIFRASAESQQDLRKQRGLYAKRVPADTLPIAEDGQGNLFLLGISGDNLGKVFFWSHHDEGDQPGYANVTPVASSFDELMESLEEIGRR